MVTDDKHNGIKIAVIAVLVAGACSLTIYYQGVLEEEVLFTHLFYIPIILAALWWRWKGVSVAVLLAGMLAASHLLIWQGAAQTANDYFRSAMFIVVAIMAALLSDAVDRRKNNEAVRPGVL